MTDHAAPLRAPLLALASDADAPRAARLAAADAEGAVDLEATLARSAKALVALEAAMGAMERHAKALREALLTVLLDTGAPTLATATHTIGYSETRRVTVTDPAALPPRFLTTPEPKPDTQAIGNALRAGEAVPGAVLGNPVPTLFVRARKA